MRRNQWRGLVPGLSHGAHQKWKKISQRKFCRSTMNRFIAAVLWQRQSQLTASSAELWVTVSNVADMWPEPSSMRFTASMTILAVLFLNCELICRQTVVGSSLATLLFVVYAETELVRPDRLLAILWSYVSPISGRYWQAYFNYEHKWPHTCIQHKPIIEVWGTVPSESHYIFWAYDISEFSITLKTGKCVHIIKISLPLHIQTMYAD